MQRKIVLIVSLVAGLIAALLTRMYLTVKENEILAEKKRLVDRQCIILWYCRRGSVENNPLLAPRGECQYD